MFELPSGLARLAGEINIQLTSQNVPSARTGQLQGYQLQSFQVAFDHLNTHTFTLPGLDPRVRTSGLPIGGGFFLQSLGGGFKNDLATRHDLEHQRHGGRHLRARDRPQSLAADARSPRR